MKHPPPTDFYVAAATVIPVLYLALTVQGSIVRGLINRLNRALERIIKPGKDPARRRGPVRLLIAVASVHALMLVTAAIIAAGVAGEITALVVLLNGADSPATRDLVLSSVTGLLVVTAAGPLWLLILAWLRLQWVPVRNTWRAIRHGSDLAEGQPEPAEPAAATADAGQEAESEGEAAAELEPS